MTSTAHVALLSGVHQAHGNYDVDGDPGSHRPDEPLLLELLRAAHGLDRDQGMGDTGLIEPSTAFRQPAQKLIFTSQRGVYEAVFARGGWVSERKRPLWENERFALMATCWLVGLFRCGGCGFPKSM